MTEIVAELPVYASRVAYGRELDGLLRDSENIDALETTDVAEFGEDHDGEATIVVEESELGAGAPEPGDDTQRRLEKLLDDSFIERIGSQQRRSGNT
jgi:hypothetical protein